ncbi:sulfotransferase [Bacillus sp. JCM 19034]|uniref:sulfotransferase family protein n=1 Tax=Bacillus sp. JCM 19034 TaxID=1481928 RepID=UPI0007829801|nr:sulfotransferase [Bacillus sp. JCM 19034]
MNSNKRNSPIVIGGVGGSGTRVVAEILKALGYYLGPLNKANDNRKFASYFRQPDWFFAKSQNNKQAIYSRLQRFEDEMVNQLEKTDKIGWGWKNPITHIYLPFLMNHFPNLRYIHVIRNGLDMAYSGNKEQLKRWGAFYQIPKPTNKTELVQSSLDYWIKANKRALNLCQDKLKKRALIIRFESLCNQPEEEINKIISFLKLSQTTPIDHLASIVRKPSSINRYKEHDISIFTTKQLKDVANILTEARGE